MLQIGKIRNKGALPLSDAFTLIELILVMCLMAIVMSIAFPSLKGFFRARNLDSEAHRFLSLTRYGQSRAISEGVPMVLWMNPQQRVYGLEPQAGYTFGETNLIQFRLDDTLQMEPQVSTVVVPTQSNLWTQIAVRGAMPQIRFLPDGSISEASPNRILIRQDKDDALYITQTTNHLRYEITR